MGLPMVEIARRFFEGLKEERALELLHICEENENDYIRRHGGVLMEDLEETLKDLHGKCFLAIVSKAGDVIDDSSASACSISAISFCTRECRHTIISFSALRDEGKQQDE